FEVERSALADALTAGAASPGGLPTDLRQSWVAAGGRYPGPLYPSGGARPIDTLTPFVSAVRAAAPTPLGPPAVIYEIARTVAGAFATAAALAVVAIALLLGITQRRLADVLRTLAPLALAATWTLGLWALFGLPINFANIIGLPLLLGIGVTFPIYFVSAWR